MFRLNDQIEPFVQIMNGCRRDFVEDNREVIEKVPGRLGGRRPLDAAAGQPRRGDRGQRRRDEDPRRRTGAATCVHAASAVLG
jgi:hypothetical protein